MKLQTDRSLKTLLWLLILVAVAGCTLSYDVMLTGQVLRGNDLQPVAGAKTTLLREGNEVGTTTTDSDGEWWLETKLTSGDFFPDKAGRLYFVEYSSLTILVETEEGILEQPLSRISISEDAREICVSVLVLVDAAFSEGGSASESSDQEPS